MLNLILSFMTVYVDTFFLVQNLETKLMQPLACCFHTNVPWKSWLKHTVQKELLIYSTAKADRCHVRFSLHNSVAANVITSCLTEFLILLKNTLPPVVALLTIREATPIVIEKFPPLPYSSLVFTNQISNHFCSISFSHSVYIHKHMVKSE